MDEDRCRALVADVQVARLATVRRDGRVDLVPIVFAPVDGDLVFAVDHKPKRSTRLQRLANIEAEPQVTLLFDHYEDDWDRLWWVRVRGRAVVVPGGPATARAIDALRARYPHYQARPPDGPVVWITPTEWAGWRADP